MRGNRTKQKAETRQFYGALVSR